MTRLIIQALLCLIVLSNGYSIEIVEPNFASLTTSSYFDLYLKLTSSTGTLENQVITMSLYDTTATPPTVVSYLSLTSCTTDAYGECVVSELSISNPGTYYITFSSNDASLNSDTFEVKKGYSKAVLSLKDTQPCALFTFKLLISIYDENGSLWTSTEVEYKIKNGSNINGVFKDVTGTISNGTGELEIYFSSAGSYSLYLDCGKIKSENLLMEVTSNILKFEMVNPTKFTTNKDFSAEVGVYNSAGTTLTAGTLNSAIEITVNPITSIKGSTKAQIINGKASFSELFIGSTGTYNLTATLPNTDPITFLTQLVVESPVISSLSITQPVSNPSAKFYFTLKAQVKDQADAVFTSPSTVTLTSTEAFTGSSDQTTSDGTATFSIFFSSPGTKTLTFTCGTTTKTVTQSVLSQKLIAKVIKAPKYNDDIFEIQIGVYNHEGNELETTSGVYNIAVSISAGGVLEGTTTMDTVSGEAKFSNLKILTAGEYTLTFSSTNLDSANENVNIEALALTTLEISSEATATAFFDFTITVKGKDQKSQLVTGETTVTLTSTLGFSGETTGVLKSGVLTFKGHFTQSGNATLTANSGTLASNPVEIVVSDLSPSMIIEDFITTTDNYFYITLSLLNTAKTDYESKNGVYTLEVKLDANSENYGTWLAKDIKKGFHGFSNLVILSPGTYTFLTEITEQNSGYKFIYKDTKTYTISQEAANIPSHLNELHTLQADSSFIATAYFSKEVEVKLLDLNNEPWTKNTIVTIVSSVPFQGSDIVATTTGTAKFSLIFKSSGTGILNFITDDIQSQNITFTINPLLLTVSITPTIDISSNKIDLSLSISDSSSKTLESHNEFKAIVSINNGKLLGKTDKTFTTGQVSFDNLVLGTAGTFVFNIEVYDTDTNQNLGNVQGGNITLTADQAHVPSELQILTKVHLSAESEVTAFFDFQVHVKALDQLDELMKSSNCSASIYSDLPIIGSKILSLNNGQTSFNLYTTAKGQVDLIITVCEISETIQMTSKGLISIIYPKSHITNDANYFDIAVGVGNTQGLIESTHGAYNFTLSLTTKDKLYGTTQLLSTNGWGNFTNVVVTAPGTFRFVAKVEEKSSGLTFEANSTEEYTITEAQANVPSNIDILDTLEIKVLNSTITAYFNFDVEVLLKDQIGRLWEDDCDISLTANTSLYGTTLVKAQGGSAYFSVYTANWGPIKITAHSCSQISGTTEIMVKNLTAKVQAVDKIGNVSNSFDVEVGIYDTFGEILETKHGDFEVSLRINPEGVLVGVKTLKAENGVAYFKNVVIGNEGQFSFIARIVDMDMEAQIIELEGLKYYGITKENAHMPLELQELVETDVSVSSWTPTAYFTFTVTVELKDQLNDFYQKGCEVVLAGSTDIHGTTYQNTKTGSFSFPIYSKTPGDLSLIVTSCSQQSETVNVTVKALSISDDVESHIESDSNYFDINVALMDSSKQFTEKDNGKYSIVLSLSPEGLLSGKTSAQAINGQYPFERITILSVGTFNFQITVSDESTNKVITSVLSTNTYLITNLTASVPGSLLQISDIDIKAPESVTVFEDFSVDVAIMDQQGNLWGDECTVVINANMTISGETKQVSKNGTFTFGIYFTETGTVSLTVLTCDSMTSSFIMNLLPCLQKVNVVEHIANDSNYFEVTIGIYDYSGENLLEKYGTFDTSLYLVPEGKLAGKANGNTRGGQKYFSPITILTPGSFQFAVNTSEEASGVMPTNSPLVLANIYNITEENAFIPQNMLTLSYMNITSDQPNPTAFFYFNIEILLFDQINSTWYPDCNVSISADSEIFSYDQSETIEGLAVQGVANFTVYLKKPGLTIITATTDTGLTAELSLTVLKEKQKIEITPYIKSDSNYFDVQVGIYDYNGTNLESTNGNYSVSLYLTNAGTMLGNLTKFSEEGVAYFHGLTIISTGNFEFASEASEESVNFKVITDLVSDRMFNISSEQTHIPLKSIQIIHHPPEPTQYFNSYLEVLLLDINEMLLNESRTINITSQQQYVGPSSLTPIDGNATFKFYFIESIESSITITSKEIISNHICIVQNMPPYALLVLIIMFWSNWVILIILWIADKSTLPEIEHPTGFSLYCPIVNIFYPQHGHQRGAFTLRTFSELFVLYTLIGYLYYFENIIQSDQSDGFESFSASDMYLGLIAFGITEAYSFVVTLLHNSAINNFIVRKLVTVITVAVIVGASVCSWVFLYKVSPQYYLFWVICFFIYTAIHIFVVQPIIALMFACCCSCCGKERGYSPMMSPRDLRSPLIQNSYFNFSMPSPRANRVSLLHVN